LQKPPTAGGLKIVATDTKEDPGYRCLPPSPMTNFSKGQTEAGTRSAMPVNTDVRRAFAAEA
jgi:hypothetical protein